MAERLELAKDRKPQRQLMAAMAQLDCGQCGYLCQTYAEAVWSGAEADMGRCVPGGKETQRKLKELLAALEPQRDGSGCGAGAEDPRRPSGSRDRPALATLVDAYPLNRPGSAKDVRHVVLDLSATDLTYEAGDSLGVFARKNPQLVQAVLDRVGATGEEMVAFDGEALPLRQVLLSKVDIARPSDDCMLFLAERAFDGEEALKLQALAGGEGPAELAEADLLDLLMAFPSVMPSLPGPAEVARPPAAAALLDRLVAQGASARGPSHRVGGALGQQRAHAARHRLLLSRRFRQAGRRHPGLRAEEPRLRPAGRRRCAGDHGRPGHRHRAVPRLPRGTRGARARRGRNWLFFGDQTRSTDFLYEDQIMDWQRRGVLHRLDLAFSRDQAEKIYVQHRMQEAAAELWQWLEEGAHFYVCGDAKRMAKDVEDTLLRIAAEQGGKSERPGEGLARRPDQGRPLPARCLLIFRSADLQVRSWP